jgi:hypothetical protein
MATPFEKFAEVERILDGSHGLQYTEHMLLVRVVMPKLDSLPAVDTREVAHPCVTCTPGVRH